MERVRKLLHANEVHAAGITGRGVTVAVLDTGICMHPDYAERIVCFQDFVGGRSNCYDDASHGSHVSGIIGGDGRCQNGRFCGMAPGCGLVHVKVLDRFGQGNLENIIDAIRWVIENKGRYGIRLMNLSAGTAKTEEDEVAEELIRWVERAWDADIVVVVAAGNMGPMPMSITVPGNSRKVITVGASDEFLYRPKQGSRNYSGCGPTQECVCKPELIAPGTNIVSCSPYWRNGRYYSVKSGTSMAAPAVTGGIALLLEKEPGLTNVEVKMRMKECAAGLGYPENRQGWGMPDFRKLLRV